MCVILVQMSHNLKTTVAPSTHRIHQLQNETNDDLRHFQQQTTILTKNKNQPLFLDFY